MTTSNAIGVARDALCDLDSSAFLDGIDVLGASALHAGTLNRCGRITTVCRNLEAQHTAFVVVADLALALWEDSVLVTEVRV